MSSLVATGNSMTSGRSFSVCTGSVIVVGSIFILLLYFANYLSGKCVWFSVQSALLLSATQAWDNRLWGWWRDESKVEQMEDGAKKLTQNIKRNWDFACFFFGTTRILFRRKWRWFIVQINRYRIPNVSGSKNNTFVNRFSKRNANRNN